jgi:hypothetical protein
MLLSARHKRIFIKMVYCSLLALGITCMCLGWFFFGIVVYVLYFIFWGIQLTT